MSLLTPPSTAHRRAKDKENSRDADSKSRLVWAETNKIHVLQLAGPAATSFKVSTGASALKRPPNKSILKKCVATEPWPVEKQREVTPEPEDPMADLNYLVFPVTTIVEATDATELRALIEAYSILTARLRAAVTGTTEADGSWPLFDPLRKHLERFADAVVRDLGRVLVDPAASKEDKEVSVRILLPSPTNTPVKKKKRDGMSAEQVKYARDLCTTTHAVIRLLSLVFTLPAIMTVFTDIQLRTMFTAVLAIPLADDLPTPNARKTWALAIWLIQTQRLSAAVLAPAADRIALALCRGIDGELGKEGKKGSASDGLKAIHDLSVHLPAVFIPAFTHSLLHSVLTSLLAPTLALRTIAAHALGGFVIGATSLKNSFIHSEISNIVLKYITTLPPPRAASTSPTKPSISPKKPGHTPQTPTKLQEPSIVRTLRTTLQATDPAHVAHGPVWAICVLSALLALLGPAAMRVGHLRVLVQLGMRHKNRNIRALTAAMWRCIVWVYVHPRLITAEDEDGEDEVDEKEMEREVKLRDEWWKVVASVVEFETGVCTIAATIGSGNAGVPVYEPGQWVDTRLSEEEREELPLRRALEMLFVMTSKDVPTRDSAVDTLKAMLGLSQSVESLQTAMEHEAEEKSLVPRSLFSAMPGLLTVEYGALKNPVNAVFDETPKAEDVRRLTKAEIGKAWVWEGVVRTWRAALGAAPSLSSGGLKRTGSRGLEIPGFSSSPKSSIARLGLARDMWSIICRLVPHSTLESAAEELLHCLVKNMEEYTSFGSSASTRDLAEEEDEDEKEMNEEWVELCVEVLAACGEDVTSDFWAGEKGKGVAGLKASEKALIWRVFAKGWVTQNADAGWSCAVCALAAPFRGRETWVLTAEDAEAWQSLLDFAVRAALDTGNDSNDVLAFIAGLVSHCDVGFNPVQIRLVEFVFNNLAKNATEGDLRELPEAVLEFAAKTMCAAYPPSRDQTTYRWTARALTSLIENCPHHLLNALGGSVTEALATWLGDAEDRWEQEVIEYDIAPLYDILLSTLQGHVSVRVLSTFSGALCAPLVHGTRSEIREPAITAFKEFWSSTYANVDVPKGGWNEDITTCLSSAFGPPMEKEDVVTAELEAAFIPRPSTPASSISETLANTPSTPCSSYTTSWYDHTPLNTPSTPIRPCKTTRSFTHTLMHSPESPMPSSRLSVLSRPPSPRVSRYSPVKRRKLVNGNKENLSPVKEQAVTSVIDRIIASSPSAPMVNLGKRRFEEDSYSTDSSDDERRIVESLVMPSEDDVFGTPARHVSSHPSGKSSGVARTGKKRKRLVIDAVELTTRRLKPSASFELASQPAIAKSSLRRARSETKIRDATSDSRSTKRRKGEAQVDSDVEEIFDISMVPLQALIPSMNGSASSYRPYYLARQHSKPSVPSSEISSDDDPHLGQVTPHHLISPELKRTRGIALIDPPSDDSVVASPSKDLVERRLHRIGSMSKITPMPFVV
ncbi:hypothetical protein H0H87_004432 [Tephrocybe sp. NHM501043]|nr:hypothetical protein H0H87_004432 [Tephrocybe sp. NHM501043]